MLQKLRRPVAVMLVLIMLVSLFAVAPVTASADTAAHETLDMTQYYRVINTSYYAQEHIGENVSVAPTSIMVNCDENGWYLDPDGLGAEVKALKGKMISKLVVSVRQSNGAPIVSFRLGGDSVIPAASVDGNTYTFENINSNKAYIYASRDLQEDQELQIDRIDVYFAEKAFVRSRALNLSRGIGISYFIDPSAAGLAPGESGELKVDFQWESREARSDIASQGTTVAIDSSNYASSGDLIKVTCYVCAAEMAETVVMKATLGGKTYTDYNSVLNYCEQVLHASDEWIANYNASLPEGSSMTYDRFLDSIVKTLDYSVKAQKLFGVYSYSEIEAEISDYVMQDVTPEMLDQAILKANGRAADDIAAAAESFGAKYCTAGMLALSTNTLRLYFTESAESFDPSDFNGSKGDYRYVQVSDIDVTMLDELKSFTVGDTTLHYSAFDYAKEVLASPNSSEKLRDFVKAMYWYNRAVEAYAGNQEAAEATVPYTRRDETPAPTPAPSEPVPYYVAGTMTDWEARDFYHMKRSDNADAVEYRLFMRFYAGDEFKIIMDDDEEIAWYPDGEGNNYQITESGLYNVYFRPNADGGDGWHCGMINVERVPATVYAESLEVGDAITAADIDFNSEDDTVILKGGSYASFDGDRVEVQTEDKAFPKDTFFYNLKTATAYDVALKAYLDTYEAIVYTDAFDRYVPCDKDGGRTDALYVLAKTDNTITLGGYPTVCLGDADGDGKVTISDATLIQRYDINAIGFSDVQCKAADVDGDGKVTIIDVTLIQRWLAGITVKYPINEFV